MDSNNKTVFGVIAQTIKALCLMLIQLFDVADEGIAMANKAVRVARERQAIELDLSNAQYKELAVKKAAMEQQRVYDEMSAYVQKDSTGERGKLLQARIDALNQVADKSLAEVALARNERKN